MSPRVLLDTLMNGSYPYWMWRTVKHDWFGGRSFARGRTRGLVTLLALATMAAEKGGPES